MVRADPFIAEACYIELYFDKISAILIDIGIADIYMHDIYDGRKIKRR